MRAVKLRFHDGDWRADLAVVERVREAVGDRLEIMVDANQGWRMPGDRAPRWDVATAIQCARALEQLGVYWLEEPLRTDDHEGYAALRAATASGSQPASWCATPRTARDLAVRGLVDVVQSDVLFVGGLGGCRRIAALCDLHGRSWSPHTWSNGLGLVANLHGALACSTVAWVEVPYDPPTWSPERRDWLLPDPLEIASDGTIAPPPGPGLGVEPDLDALERMAGRVRTRAAVLHRPGEPVAIEDVELDPPKAGRGPRTRRPPRASATRTCDTRTASSGWSTGR